MFCPFCLGPVMDTKSHLIDVHKFNNRDECHNIIELLSAFTTYSVAHGQASLTRKLAAVLELLDFRGHIDNLLPPVVNGTAKENGDQNANTPSSSSEEWADPPRASIIDHGVSNQHDDSIEIARSNSKSTLAKVKHHSSLFKRRLQLMHRSRQRSNGLVVAGLGDRCRICQERIRKTQVEFHVLLKHMGGMNVYQCRLCSFSAKLRILMANHCRSSHPAADDATLDSSAFVQTKKIHTDEFNSTLEQCFPRWFQDLRETELNDIVDDDVPLEQFDDQDLRFSDFDTTSNDDSDFVTCAIDVIPDESDVITATSDSLFPDYVDNPEAGSGQTSNSLCREIQALATQRGQKRLRCKLCDADLGLNESTLKNHIVRHASSPLQFRCLLCFMGPMSSTKMSLHHGSEHGSERTYRAELTNNSLLNCLKTIYACFEFNLLPSDHALSLPSPKMPFQSELAGGASLLSSVGSDQCAGSGVTIGALVREVQQQCQLDSHTSVPLMCGLCNAKLSSSGTSLRAHLCQHASTNLKMNCLTCFQGPFCYDEIQRHCKQVHNNQLLQGELTQESYGLMKDLALRCFSVGVSDESAVNEDSFESVITRYEATKGYDCMDAGLGSGEQAASGHSLYSLVCDLQAVSVPDGERRIHCSLCNNDVSFITTVLVKHIQSHLVAPLSFICGSCKAGPLSFRDIKQHKDVVHSSEGVRFELTVKSAQEFVELLRNAFGVQLSSTLNPSAQEGVSGMTRLMNINCRAGSVSTLIRRLLAQLPVPTNTAIEIPCRVCHKMIRSVTMREHVYIHMDGIMVECGLCFQRFESYPKVLSHNRKAHANQRPKSRTILDGPGYQAYEGMARRCLGIGLPPVIATAKISVKREIEFDCKPGTSGQRLAISPIAATTGPAPKRVNCKKCNQSVDRAKEPKTHVFSHMVRDHSIKPFGCAHCRLKFNTRQGVLGHLGPAHGVSRPKGYYENDIVLLWMKHKVLMTRLLKECFPSMNLAQSRIDGVVKRKRGGMSPSEEIDPIALPVQKSAKFELKLAEETLTRSSSSMVSSSPSGSEPTARCSICKNKKAGFPRSRRLVHVLKHYGERMNVDAFKCLNCDYTHSLNWGIRKHCKTNHNFATDFGVDYGIVVEMNDSDLTDLWDACFPRFPMPESFEDRDVLDDTKELVAATPPVAAVKARKPVVVSIFPESPLEEFVVEEDLFSLPVEAVTSSAPPVLTEDNRAAITCNYCAESIPLTGCFTEINRKLLCHVEKHVCDEGYNLFQCLHCNMQPTSWRSLYGHMRKQHKIYGAIGVINKDYIDERARYLDIIKNVWMTSFPSRELPRSLAALETNQPNNMEDNEGASCSNSDTETMNYMIDSSFVKIEPFNDYECDDSASTTLSAFEPRRKCTVCAERVSNRDQLAHAATHVHMLPFRCLISDGETGESCCYTSLTHDQMIAHGEQRHPGISTAQHFEYIASAKDEIDKVCEECFF